MELPKEISVMLEKLGNKEIHGCCVIFKSNLVAQKWERRLREYFRKSGDDKINKTYISMKRPEEMLDTLMMYNSLMYGKRFDKNDDMFLREVFSNAYCVYDEQVVNILLLKLGQGANYQELVEVKDKRRYNTLAKESFKKRISNEKERV